jgi:hypothetical protein
MPFRRGRARSAQSPNLRLAAPGKSKDLERHIVQGRDAETVEPAGMSETSGRSHVQMLLLLYNSIFLTNALRFSRRWSALGDI